MKSYVKSQLIRLRVFLIFDAIKRNKYIKKKKIFYSIGENVFFQPRKLPSDPKLIKFGNNVTVASDVTFINHDLIHKVLNNMQSEIYFNYYSGPIEIGDNVFIGSKTIIMPNIKIGSNVIIAAGSIVTKDIESNSVVGGIPAKKISTFDEYLEKRKLDNNNILDSADYEVIWRQFNERKNK